MHRACPVCTHPGGDPRLAKGTLSLVQCPRCRMVFADPLPSEAATDYYDRLGRPFYLSPDKLAGDFASVRFERELRLLRRECPGGDLLDVGCSTGAFLHQLRQRFPGDYRGAGIEISTAALEHARSMGLEVLEASLLTHDFGRRRFDAITFWAVLEHLPEPRAFLQRARELLRPGGVCLVLVPNFESLAVRLLGARYRYILPQHVNYFTTSTLEELLRRSGLEPVRAGGSHFNPAVLWQDARRGTNANVPDAERAALLARTTRLKQSPWLAPARATLNTMERFLALARLADNLWSVGHRSEAG